MRALVTGGAGFIGSHITDALLAGGHEVAVVDDLSRGHREQVPQGATLHVVDITSDALPPVIADFRPEVVFHQAAQIDVRRSVREPLLDTSINVLGTVNLMQACATNGVRRAVFASSGGAIYGDTDVLPTGEDHPCRPASQYGAAKLCAEVYGDVFRQLYGIDFVALRYANVYGPRQDPHGEAGVVAIFAERLLRGEGAMINGDGTQTRDYVFVGDVVAANLAAMSTGKPGAYNIGTSRQTDVNELYELIAGSCGVERKAEHGPGKEGEQRASCLSIEHAREALDWEPQMHLEQGIAATVEWFRQRIG